MNKFVAWTPGVSKATGESGYISEGGEFRKDRPTGPADTVKDAPRKFPEDHELTQAAAAPDALHLKPGGQVKRVTVAGTHYVIKQDARTAESGKVEELASTLARLGGVAAPEAKLTTAGGRPALVQQFAEGRTIESLNKQSPDLARQMVQSVPKAEIDRNVLTDYLLGNTDVHNGNYLVSPDHHLVPIDKEFILGRGNLTGQKFIPPKFLWLAHPDGNGMAHEFDPASLKAAVVAGEEMARELDKRGLSKQARQVRDRAVVLARLARDPAPTVQALEQLGNQGVTPPDLSVIGKLKWHLTKG